jgi:hypothetical protein
MADELAIHYLKRSALIAAIKNESQFNRSRPISKMFTRQGHGADFVEVRVGTRYSDQVRHTTMDGEGVPIKSGTFKVRHYLPAWMKVFAELTQKDATLFAKAEEVAQSKDSGGQAVIDRANERIRELGADLDANLGTERERLCVDALKGTLTATLQDGTAQSVSYGLTALTAPSTKWNDAAAVIQQDFYGAIDEFKANNPLGLPPTDIAYHPKLWKESLAKNTEWKEFRKSSPALAEGFLRLMGGKIEANVEGYFTDPLFGLRWHAIDGTYRNLSDSITNYWDYKDLTLFRADEAMFEWGMTYGHEYNPRPDVNIALRGAESPGCARVARARHGQRPADHQAPGARADLAGDHLTEAWCRRRTQWCSATRRSHSSKKRSTRSRCCPCAALLARHRST